MPELADRAAHLGVQRTADRLKAWWPGPSLRCSNLGRAAGSFHGCPQPWLAGLSRFNPILCPRHFRKPRKTKRRRLPVSIQETDRPAHLGVTKGRERLDPGGPGSVLTAGTGRSSGGRLHGVSPTSADLRPTHSTREFKARLIPDLRIGRPARGSSKKTQVKTMGMARDRGRLRPSR